MKQEDEMKKPDYGEPWIVGRIDRPMEDRHGHDPLMLHRTASRAVACVNACAGMADPAKEIASLKSERDEAIKELKLEKNIRKNLQHVIVSKWGADSIGRCIDAIRQVENGIGPLGPINDWSLAQILSAHLQQPAELIINDLRQQITKLESGAVDAAAEIAAMREAIREAAEALDSLSLVVGLTPIAGNKEALQEANDQARTTLAKLQPFINS